jgi:hypothetical protein
MSSSISSPFILGRGGHPSGQEKVARLFSISSFHPLFDYTQRQLRLLAEMRWKREKCHHRNLEEEIVVAGQKDDVTFDDDHNRRMRDEKKKRHQKTINGNCFGQSFRSRISGRKLQLKGSILLMRIARSQHQNDDVLSGNTEQAARLAKHCSHRQRRRRRRRNRLK